MNNKTQKIKKRLKKSEKHLPKVVTAVIVLGVALLGTYLLFEAHAASNPPTVAISNLSDDGYVNSSSQVVDVTATPNDGGSISSCTLSINSATIGNPITTAPFNFTFIPLNFANGYINLSVSCTDDQGDIGTVSETPIVNNGDLTNAGIVGIADLAIMASNWDKTGQTYAQGNITGNGAVGVSDLAILASNWGWKAPVMSLSNSSQSATVASYTNGVAGQTDATITFTGPVPSSWLAASGDVAGSAVVDTINPTVIADQSGGSGNPTGPTIASINGDTISLEQEVLNGNAAITGYTPVAMTMTGADIGDVIRAATCTAYGGTDGCPLYSEIAGSAGMIQKGNLNWDNPLWFIGQDASPSRIYERFGTRWCWWWYRCNYGG